MLYTVKTCGGRGARAKRTWKGPAQVLCTENSWHEELSSYSGGTRKALVPGFPAVTGWWGGGIGPYCGPEQNEKAPLEESTWPAGPARTDAGGGSDPFGEEASDRQNQNVAKLASKGVFQIFQERCIGRDNPASKNSGVDKIHISLNC